MHGLAFIALCVAALYCATVWGWLFYRSVKTGTENWEEETFHLGLCFVIAVGFLYIGSL